MTSQRVEIVACLLGARVLARAGKEQSRRVGARPVSELRAWVSGELEPAASAD